MFNQIIKINLNIYFVLLLHMITVFSKHGCPNCVVLKKILKDSGFKYKEEILKNLYELSKYVGEDNAISFPMIYTSENGNDIFLDFDSFSIC